MGKDPTRSPKTYQNASTVNQVSKPTKTTTTVTARQSSRLNRLGHIIMGAWAMVAAIATSSNFRGVQLLESQAQSLFFELRGPVAPPDNIVIVAIDNQSLSEGEQYQIDPQKYAYLEPLQAWPWKRTAYAQVIERLMAAGARSVAMDILLADPSSYGSSDDQRLAEVLQRYAGKVTLAAEFIEYKSDQGNLMQLTEPQPLFWTDPKSIGSVNFPLEVNRKVHRFASEFPKLLAENDQEQGDNFAPLKTGIPSFEQAAAAAAQQSLIKPKGEYIHFYGPPGTFKQISFSHILDPENWNTYLQQGKYFKDKIVIIGATATSLQDFHGAPFSESWLYPERMSGVEIQANAIASLLENRAIALGIPNRGMQGLFVLILVAGAGILLARPQRVLPRFIYPMAISTTWAAISYFSFVHAQLILPTAAPIAAIALGGFSYLATGTASESLKRLHLRRTLQRYASSPVVQEIISQQDDLHDLLYQRELATLGKIIGGRYKIVKVLGAGGFSETYIAEDNQRPGNPLCVVKQLRPAKNDPKHLQLARRLFQLEAETLEKLGKHNQIPQLFAYFEEEEFYLVQELIVGHPLSHELHQGKPIPEAAVIQILQDLLQTLKFVHSYNVIHRDIKPSNIIRRHSDGKLVLIDFGAVKELSAQLLEHDEQTGYTIGIGTQGYAPSEQCAGRVRFNSDIYAVGMIGIKALTGLTPHELKLDSETGECLWTHNAQVSPELTAILNKMVRYDFNQRYQSVSEVELALEELVNSSTSFLVLDYSPTESPEDTNTPTAPWIPVTTEIPDSSSSTIFLPPQ